MAALVLAIGFGLGVLWLVAMGTAGVAAGWYAWLVFLAACALILAGFVQLQRRSEL